MNKFNASNPGFEHLTDEQILGRSLGMILESKEDENYETLYSVKQQNHEATLRHIDEPIQCLEKQDDTTLCDEFC